MKRHSNGFIFVNSIIIKDKTSGSLIEGESITGLDSSSTMLSDICII